MEPAVGMATAQYARRRSVGRPLLHTANTVSIMPVVIGTGLVPAYVNIKRLTSIGRESVGSMEPEIPAVAAAAATAAIRAA